jgi:hypothetical protein
MRRLPAQFTLCPHLLGDILNSDNQGRLSVKKLNFDIIIKYINFIIPFLYIVMGCVFFTNLFPAIDRSHRIIFGIILIIYGAFRIYKTYEKIRENR